MSKRITVLLLLLLLCACDKKEKTVICEKEMDDSFISIYLVSDYDAIKEIRLKEVITFPYNVLSDKEKLDDLIEQIDEDYRLEDNHLVYEKEIIIDQKYSLRKTLDELDKEYFYCAL